MMAVYGKDSDVHGDGLDVQSDSGNLRQVSPSVSISTTFKRPSLLFHFQFLP